MTESRARLTQQATLNKTKETKKSLHATEHVKQSMQLPEMSNSGTIGYVEDWLEKAESKPIFYLEKENEPLINSEKCNLENDPCLMSVAEKVKSLKEKSKVSNSSSAPVPELTRNGSVRQKIRSFEHKSDDKKHSDSNSHKNSLFTNSEDCLSTSNNICSKNSVSDLLNKTASITVQFAEGSNSLSMDLPPPPHESLLESCCDHRVEVSAASSPLYRLSSVSDIHPFSTSPTSDRAISPTDHTMEMASSIQADNSSEMRDALLQRVPSIKRAPLVSNLSLERKMSLKKASLDEYTIPKETTSLPIHIVTNNSLGKSTSRKTAGRLKSKGIIDSKSSQPHVSSVSPASLTTDHRTSSTSVLSTEAPQKSNEVSVSPKPKDKKVKLAGSPTERTKRLSSDIMKKSQRVPSINNNLANKKASPNVERKKSATPSASPASEKRQILSKSKLPKTSPYSQSLDLASPPVKHKTSKKSLNRNLSTDSALPASTNTSRMTSTPKRAAEGLQLKQSNKANLEESVQSQGTSGSTIDKNAKENQLTRTELLANILDADLKTNENEDEAHNKTSASEVEEKHGACEMNKQPTEHLSENSAREICMSDPQCYVELNADKPSSRQNPDSQSDTTSLCESDIKHSTYSSGIEVPCSIDDTATDIDELSFSEEDLQKENKELKVIVEELLSDDEQEADPDLTLKTQLIENVDAHSVNDNGHDNSSCLEHVKTNKEMTSVDEELNSDDVLLSEDEKFENIAKKLCDEVISQSVAKRITCFAENVTNNLKRSTVSMDTSQRKGSVVSDGEESSSESHMSQLNPGTRSAPQSSLSFSYDSSSVVTKQPEGNRVKSIREMFLAKSTTDTPKQSSCQNSADMTELRAETSVSGGYQSQTSSELSSGEDDSSRKSITKGFVMRTIERLYGKKESPAPWDKMDRPLSAQKEKKKDQTSIFSPFHAARSKTVSELSYFNSSNALDTLTEATRCLAFNAQVGPGDSLLIDNGQWLLQDSTAMRKSVSDPVAISQRLSRSTQEETEPCTDTEEKTPYLLFKTDSEDEQKSLSRKCTYFSLPHGSDSEAVLDECPVKGDIKSDCCESKDNPDNTKIKSEKNGKLSGVTDFKIMDNKVHPLVEAPSDGEAVVVQPARGQTVINRRLQEPDMLDFLYNFCGENCPIL